MSMDQWIPVFVAFFGAITAVSVAYGEVNRRALEHVKSSVNGMVATGRAESFAAGARSQTAPPVEPEWGAAARAAGWSPPPRA
jgi:hypothetical protein